MLSMARFLMELMINTIVEKCKSDKLFGPVNVSMSELWSATYESEDMEAQGPLSPG